MKGIGAWSVPFSRMCPLDRAAAGRQNYLLCRNHEEVAIIRTTVEQFGISTIRLFRIYCKIAVYWAALCWTRHSVVSGILRLNRDLSTVFENGTVADNDNMGCAGLFTHVSEIACKVVRRYYEKRRRNEPVLCQCRSHRCKQKH